MPVLFLDTQIWNYLVDHGSYSIDQLRRARERLTEGVRAGEWEIVGSLPVLQEVVRVYRNNPQKYEVIKALMFESVSKRWLLDTKERYVAELHSGGILPVTGRYISREKRRQIERLANNKKDIIEVGDITYREGLMHKEVMEDAKNRVFTELGSADGTPPKKIGRAYEKWFVDGRDTEGWTLKVLEGGVVRKLFPASKIHDFHPSFSNIPTVWQYVEFHQAKILLNLGHARAIKGSDGVDADIYGCSPYYDLLVTEDKPFKDTIDPIVGSRFTVYSFKQLLAMLGIET